MLRQATKGAKDDARAAMRELHGRDVAVVSGMDRAMNAPDARAPASLVAESDAALPAVRTRNRGWLVRRSLVAADVVGLVAALFVAERIVQDESGAPNALRGLGEYLVFFASLPAWILLARQYGLYARDAEQPAYSTVDDFLRVVNM